MLLLAYFTEDETHEYYMNKTDHLMHLVQWKTYGLQGQSVSPSVLGRCVLLGKSLPFLELQFALLDVGTESPEGWVT